MENNYISEPVLTISTGWFRYNYYENRLEFLNHDSKLVVQTWEIPSDQWEALPSQQEYCENIVKEAIQQKKNQVLKGQTLRSRRQIIFFVSLIVAVVCWYLTLSGTVEVNTDADVYISAIAIFATSAASFTGLSLLRNRI